MKIIFLDIDGVLNSRAYDRKRNWNEQTDIDETRLPLIKEIVDATGAKIVLSSTWRQHWNKDSIVAMWTVDTSIEPLQSSGWQYTIKHPTSASTH